MSFCRLKSGIASFRTWFLRWATAPPIVEGSEERPVRFMCLTFRTERDGISGVKYHHCDFYHTYTLADVDVVFHVPLSMLDPPLEYC